MSILIKNNKVIVLNTEESTDESKESIYYRKLYIISQENNTKEEFENNIMNSKFAVNIKMLNCDYNYNIMKEVRSQMNNVMMTTIK